LSRLLRQEITIEARILRDFQAIAGNPDIETRIGNSEEHLEHRR
jgi:hypothetical protein